MKRTIVLAAAAWLGALALLGCYEPPGVTLYEPGVYKGADDPLLDKLADEELQQALEARVRRVQADR